jgi:hypothetical protein
LFGVFFYNWCQRMAVYEVGENGARNYPPIRNLPARTALA